MRRVPVGRAPLLGAQLRLELRAMRLRGEGGGRATSQGCMEEDQGMICYAGEGRNERQSRAGK